MRHAFRPNLALAVLSGVGLLAHHATADTITGFTYNNAVFEQTSDVPPANPARYFFTIGANFSNPGDFTTASATYPGPGSPQSLPPLGTTEFNFSSSPYSSLSALHSDYLFGTYSITASGPAGTQTSNVPYSADYFASATPYVSNFSNLSGLDPAAAFTVDYPAFTPNPNVTQGFTFFTVYDAGTGAVLFSNGFQSPSSISTLIPAGTLMANTAYDFELDYSDRLDGFDDLNGTFTEQGFDLRTDGTFTTGSVPVPEPASLLTLGSGLLVMGWLRRRRGAVSGKVA